MYPRVLHRRHVISTRLYWQKGSILIRSLHRAAPQLLAHAAMRAGFMKGLLSVGAPEWRDVLERVRPRHQPLGCSCSNRRRARGSDHPGRRYVPVPYRIALLHHSTISQPG